MWSVNGGRRAWVLNLDAEHELEARGNYAPTLHLKALVARESARLVGQLVAHGDVIVTEELLASGGKAAEAARGLPGYAWSPTPSATKLLVRAGAIPVAAPAVAVLRTVNERAFAALVREPLAKSSFEKRVVGSIDAALLELSRPAPEGWLVRRAFGAAGRGRRRLRSGIPSEGERAWLDASLRRGALVIEPWVRVTVEHTRSAWIERDGTTSISPPCFQATTEHGAWLRTELAPRGDVSREDDARLEEAVAVAGEALARAGYFGPFGIDAYRHQLPGSTKTVLNPLSEINARFTMDWATAMRIR
ncbi:MAG TPA: hypothetical protein VM509_00695 [Planctomycetota bacterium]|nr:hypothetical protein [Planctomycetota bacterium]